MTGKNTEGHAGSKNSTSEVLEKQKYLKGVIKINYSKIPGESELAIPNFSTANCDAICEASFLLKAFNKGLYILSVFSEQIKLTKQVILH